MELELELDRGQFDHEKHVVAFSRAHLEGQSDGTQIATSGLSLLAGCFKSEAAGHFRMGRQKCSNNDVAQQALQLQNVGVKKCASGDLVSVLRHVAGRPRSSAVGVGPDNRAAPGLWSVHFLGNALRGAEYKK